MAISKNGVGVSSRAMRDAVTNPLTDIQQLGGRFLYIGQNAVVILRGRQGRQYVGHTQGRLEKYSMRRYGYGIT